MPLLTPPVELAVRRFLRQKIVNNAGVYVHEIGGIETHVHLAVTIVPTIPIADFVGQLKGSSAHNVNQQLGKGRKLLQWQTGYGIVSFGTKDLEWVVDYIRNQREHHAKGTVHKRLERITHEELAQASHREAP
jgi:putative transposase